MFEFRYVTHSIRTFEQLEYVIRRGFVAPRRRYWYLPYTIFGLSVNGAYTYMNSVCVVHFVFPWSVVKRYGVKPVIYHPYDLKVMLSSRDGKVYYYPDVFAFEMELVSEHPIPLSEVEEIYISPGVDLEPETLRKLREYAPVSYGTPVDQETVPWIQQLMHDKSLVREYNRRVAEEFGIDYAEPTPSELLELFLWWWSHSCGDKPQISQLRGKP